MTKLMRVAALAAAASLALAGCGDGGSEDTGDITPENTAAAGELTCDAVEWGPVTRCENFYDDYWPVINENLDALYEEAKSTDGGKLVIWDWYEQSPDVVAAFNERFPDIKVVSRGLTYNLSSAIISAKASGERNSDIVSGSITSMTAMYDQGFWQDVDWTQYGVPEEFFTIGAPELLPDSWNGSLLQYNSSDVPEVPSSLDDLASGDWSGKLAIANYNAQDFSGYGMRFGEQAMVDLIDNLKSSGNLAVVDDTSSLLSSGDKPVAFGGQLFSPNKNLGVTAFDGVNEFAQFSGVNSDAKNKAAAVLWILWNAYDPDWIQTRLTDDTFATSAVPFPGLPTATLEQATGLVKKNMDAWFAGVDAGQAEFESQDNRDDWNKMIKAADKALNG